MTDVKRSRPTKRPAKGKKTNVPKSIRFNEMFYKCSWTTPLLTASTSGAISNSGLGFSIQNSTEYSSLSTVFAEVKLLSAKVVFTARGTYSATNASRIMGGYHSEYNSTTFTNPTQFSSVANLTKRFTICSNLVMPHIYVVPVPKGLEFTAFNADAPTLPFPGAGSPGTVMVYGTNFQASQDYFTVDYLDVCYHLKYRV